MSKKKKRIIHFVLFTFLSLTLSAHTAFADSLVTGGCYVTVGTSELGKVTIYIPIEYQENWAFINGLPVSTSNSTITGYILTSAGAGRYAVRIYNYCNGWQYRTYGSSTSPYYDLTVNAYFPQESSIFIKKYRSNTSNLIFYTLVLLLGVSVVSIFFRRS